MLNLQKTKQPRFATAYNQMQSVQRCKHIRLHTVNAYFSAEIYAVVNSSKPVRNVSQLHKSMHYAERMPFGHDQGAELSTIHKDTCIQHPKNQL